MDLPRLENWGNTRISLHNAAQLTGALRRALLPPMPNGLRFSQQVIRDGLSTGRLPDGSRFDLDYAYMTLRYFAPNTEKPQNFILQDKPAAAALDWIRECVPDATINTDDLPAAPLTVDFYQARDYALMQWQVFTAMARFRAQLLGMMTPAVVWTHGFDLSFLWFKGNEADEKQQPHINFGFSPGSPGFDDPYLYVYNWSPDKGAQTITPSSPARWNTDGFTGVVVDYKVLLRYAHPEAFIAGVYDEAHRLMAPLL